MLGLAILPAAVLIGYIYRKDTIEKEPVGLLLQLLGLGALTTISALILELTLGGVLSRIVREGTLLYQFISCFFVIAFAEEVGKYVVLRLRTWNSPHFSHVFDAIVYAVVVSLGFALLENILYLVDSSLSTAIMRGLLAVPGHAIDGVYMGMFYGQAKLAACENDPRRSKRYSILALVVPMLTHGFYDFCLFAAELSSATALISLSVFLVFEIAINIVTVRVVRRQSANDRPLPSLTMFCPQCGTTVPRTASFCPQCGHNLRH